MKRNRRIALAILLCVGALLAAGTQRSAGAQSLARSAISDVPLRAAPDVESDDTARIAEAARSPNVEATNSIASEAEHSAAGAGADATTGNVFPVRPIPLALAHLNPSSNLGRAYLDAFTILSADNPCSRFFGGAAGATLVLNKLGSQLQLTMLDNPAVGVRMYGYMTTYMDLPTGISYRLFDHAKVNTHGPFYAARRPHPLTVGSFWENSREARVLMLLHELAHLIQGADGRWLIPDDAGDRSLSGRNTATIEAACRAQIRAVG